MARVEPMEVPIELAGPARDLLDLLKDVRALGRHDICCAEALGALLDEQLDDNAARIKARDWLVHERRLR